MNPDIKKQWVKALRSGDYVQTTHGLKNDEGYCCLGVLYDLGIKAGIIPDWTRKRDEYYETEDGSSAVLSEKICQWAGVRPSPHADSASLMGKNDHGCSFLEIADLIEHATEVF